MPPTLRLVFLTIIPLLAPLRAEPDLVPLPDPTYLDAPIPALPPEALQDQTLRDQVLGEHARKTLSSHWQGCFDRNGNKPDQLLLPGLLADKTSGRVWLWAWATGMKAGEPVEFFLINSRSGHGYESILATSASPSEIHRALEFIGLKPGWPADPGHERLWPKGDRVRFTVHARMGEGPRAVPLESFLSVTQTGQPMAPTNLVFVGSVMEPDAQNPGRKVYAADQFSPNAIASNYNLDATVFDLPRQARKEEVYGTLVRSEAPALAQGQPVLLRLERHPDFPAGAIRDLRLAVTWAEGKPVHRLLDEAGAELQSEAELDKLLPTLAKLRLAAKDLHLQVDLAPTLPAFAAARVGELLSPLDQGYGIKVDPPPAGQLFYRAFSPNPDFRDRKARPYQPWEIYLTKGADGIWSGRLVILEEKWAPEKIEPDLVETSVPAPDPGVVSKAMEGRDFLPGVVFLFAPRDLPHGEAMRWVKDIKAKFPLVYVYTDP